MYQVPGEVERDRAVQTVTLMATGAYFFNSVRSTKGHSIVVCTADCVYSCRRDKFHRL